MCVCTFGMNQKNGVHKTLSLEPALRVQHSCAESECCRYIWPRTTGRCLIRSVAASRVYMDVSHTSPSSVRRIT